MLSNPFSKSSCLFRMKKQLSSLIKDGENGSIMTRLAVVEAGLADIKEELKVPSFDKFKRKKSTVVEWGGVMLN